MSLMDDAFDDELKGRDDKQYDPSDAYIYPIDIGTWRTYDSVVLDEEQRQLQIDSLFPIAGLQVCGGELRFIYTKNIARYNDILESLSRDVRIEDTETVLETEVYYTSKIEGARTTRQRTAELHNGAPIDGNNRYSEYMVRNNFNAVRLLNLYGNRLSEDILYRVWDVLTENCRDNAHLAGMPYRSGTVYIGNHEGLDSSLIKPCMDKWISFYNGKEFDEKPFIKAAILHYAFENIHPFCDGNGRLGRLLMNNYLISRGVESCRAVSFSMQIDGKRSLYDAAFVQSENALNDCTPFIEYMLEVMADSYGTALQVQQKA